MRTIVHWAAATFGSARAHRARVGLAAAAVLIGAANAQAQVSEEFAEGSLAPAAEEMAAAGVDGSREGLATLVEIAQRHGFGYGISPDEVRELVESGYLAVRQIDCRSLDSKIEAANRLSRTLAQIAWLYAAGAGLTYIAPPVAAALGLGALIAGMSSAVAAWIVSDLRAQRSQVRCTSEGGVEWFRPAAREIKASLDPAIFRYSWQRSCGASCCA